MDVIPIVAKAKNEVNLRSKKNHKLLTKQKNYLNLSSILIEHNSLITSHNYVQGFELNLSISIKIYTPNQQEKDFHNSHFPNHNHQNWQELLGPAKSQQLLKLSMQP